VPVTLCPGWFNSPSSSIPDLYPPSSSIPDLYLNCILIYTYIIIIMIQVVNIDPQYMPHKFALRISIFRDRISYISSSFFVRLCSCHLPLSSYIPIAYIIIPISLSYYSYICFSICLSITQFIKIKHQDSHFPLSTFIRLPRVVFRSANYYYDSSLSISLIFLEYSKYISY
jgi:hypothetical protein